jgi:hypothetical protein
MSIFELALEGMLQVEQLFYIELQFYLN